MANPGDVERRSALREAFDTDGIVRVPGVLASEEVRAMRDRTWEMLEAHGVLRDDPRTWSPGGGMRLVELLGALRPGPGTDELLWEVGRAAVFAPLENALRRAVDEVFGAGVWAPVENQHGGLAAPNFPIPGRAWNVPHAAWHVDEPTAAAQPLGWGLLGFAFLDEVEPGGGATAAIAGSQRRLGKLAAAHAEPPAPGVVTTEEAIAVLGREEAWFADLFAPGDPEVRRSRFMREGHVSQGIPLRVVELTGTPGEIALMDPRCLHTVSANVSGRARLTMRMTCARRV
jgi:hypothetical protein